MDKCIAVDIPCQQYNLRPRYESESRDRRYLLLRELLEAIMDILVTQKLLSDTIA